jgi:hypothetical protein
MLGALGKSYDISMLLKEEETKLRTNNQRFISENSKILLSM